MSATDTLRIALYGNPPSQDHRPDRDGVISAFTNLDVKVSGVVAGIVYYDTGNARELDHSKSVGTLAKAADEPNYYRYTATGWVVDDTVYQGVAGIVQPLVDEAKGYADDAQASAELVSNVSNPRTFTVGAPLSLLSAASNVANAGTWYNEYPLVQTGLVKKLRCKASGVNTVTFVFSKLKADNTGLDDLISLPFQTTAGDNEFVAGVDFDPFIVLEGMYMGVHQDVGLIKYSALGNNFYRDPNGVFTIYGGVTLSFSAEIVAEKQMQSVASSKEPRTALYDVNFNQSNAPLGWNAGAGVNYSSNGMTLALSAGGNSWQNPAVFSHHHIMCDEMVVRVEWEHTTPGSIYGIGAARDPSLPIELDTTYLNSLFVIDDSKQLVPASVMYQMASTFYSAPDAILAGPNGLNADLSVGDIVTQEIKLNYGQTTYNAYNRNKASLGDTIVQGSTTAPSDFGPTGLFLPYISAHFREGNARLRRVTMLYTGFDVDMFIAGDSMTKGAPSDGDVTQSYVGLLKADGYKVARCAAPGWTSHGIVKSAVNMMRQLQPRRAMFAAMTNDYNQVVPVADFKFNVAIFIDEARRAGAEKIALAVFHPIPDHNNDAGNAIILPGLTPYNQAVFELAAGQPDIYVVRFDRALTVNADGVTPDVTKLYSDRQHQNVKGERAKYNDMRFGNAAGFLD